MNGLWKLQVAAGCGLIIATFDRAMRLMPPGGEPLAGNGPILFLFLAGVLALVHASFRARPRKAQLLLLSRWFLGLLFIGASMDKILHPGPFSDTVLNYHLLPESLVNLFALWLPLLELFTGICLVVGYWTRPAALLVAGMCLMFLVAVVQGVARGIDTHCGCFTQEGKGGAISTVTILRDVAFLAIAAYAVWKDLPESNSSLASTSPASES